MSRSIRRHMLPIEDHEQGEDFIVHLQGPILNAFLIPKVGIIKLHSLHDENIQSKTFILRIFQDGQTIPYHFSYVDTVTDSVGASYHVCQYTEDDEAWTPASMSDADVPSVVNSEPSHS